MLLYYAKRRNPHKRLAYFHGKYNEKMFEFSLFTKYTNQKLMFFLKNGEKNIIILFILSF